MPQPGVIRGRQMTGTSGPVVYPDPEPEPESVRWLALVLAEVFRTGLALIAKRYPEARGKHVCQHCGKRG